MRLRGRWQQGTHCSICAGRQVQVQGLQGQSSLQARAEPSSVKPGLCCAQGSAFWLWLVEEVGLRDTSSLVIFVPSPFLPAP